MSIREIKNEQQSTFADLTFTRFDYPGNKKRNNISIFADSTFMRFDYPGNTKWIRFQHSRIVNLVNREFCLVKNIFYKTNSLSFTDSVDHLILDGSNVLQFKFLQQSALVFRQNIDK